MAKAKRKDNKELMKWKKKKWVEIISPSIFRNNTIGETNVIDESSILGRKVSVNMMNLTGDFKKQHLTAKFVISGLKDKKANTYFYGYEMSPTSIKRMVRRRKDRIDDSFLAESNDGKNVRVKPLIITRNNISAAMQTALRRNTRIIIMNYLKKHKYDDFINNVVSRKLQNEMKKKLAKIAPLRAFEMRSVGLTKEAVEAVVDHNVIDKKAKAEAVVEEAEVPEKKDE